MRLSGHLFWTSTRQRMAAFLLIGVLTAVAYFNSLQNQFAYDDSIMVEGNKAITRIANLPEFFINDYWYGRSTSEAVTWKSGLYRPIVLVTFALNYAWGKLDPFGYHVVNVFLHFLASWLVFLVALQIGLRLPGAVVSAAVFSVHPLHTEAVANVVGRGELLMATGVLASLWFASMKRPTLSLTAFAIALFSKEQAIVLPLLLLFQDLCHPTESGTPHMSSRFAVGLARRYGPYLALLVCYFLLRKIVLGHIGMVPLPFLDNPLSHMDGTARILTAVKVAGLYLWLCLWPATLSADYSYNALPAVQSWADAGVIASVLAWGGVLTMAMYSWGKGDRRVCMAAGLLIIPFLLVSNLVFPIGTIMGERLFYLPSVGFCLFVGLAAEGIWPSLRISHSMPQTSSGLWCLGAVLCLALLIGRTVIRNQDWANTGSLMQSALKAVPGSAKVHVAVGELEMKKAEWHHALDHFQTAIGIYPDYPRVEVTINLDLAVALMKLDRLQDAIVALERAVQIDPLSSLPHYALAQAYRRATRFGEAEAQLRTALTLNKEYAEAYAALSWVLSAQGQYEEALRQSERALELQPGSPEALENRAMALAGLGRLPNSNEAIREGGPGMRAPGLVGRHHRNQ